MQTQAHFNNIKAILLQELQNAQESIYVAVAWFTDRDLFQVLVKKAQANIPVSVILIKDKINQESSNDFEQLKNIYWIEEATAERLMHHKFCVIDREVVITGSYNWSYKAQTNYENITVTKGSLAFPNSFIEEFGRIVSSNFGQNHWSAPTSSISQLIKRLELIKMLIGLEDLEDMPQQVARIQMFQEDNEVAAIIQALENKSYGEAIRHINAYNFQYRQLSAYQDPEIDALRLEIRMLETEIAAMSNEYSDMQKQVSDFSTQHHQELGDLIRKILKLRKEKLEKEAAQNTSKQQEYEEATNDYENYSHQYHKKSKEVFHQLNPDDKKTLKKLYRQAALLCHPDKVQAELKNQAEAIFHQLNTAYEQNDLPKVRQLLEQLQQGNWLLNPSHSINEKEKLQTILKNLHEKLEAWIEKLQTLKRTETYQTIVTIKDWEIYFSDLKKKLLKELERLEA